MYTQTNVGLLCCVSSGSNVAIFLDGAATGIGIRITQALNLIYKDECLFVCMELIQIHIFEPIWTKLCTRLPLGMEEVVGYVWTHNISTFPPFRRILSGASADSCAEDGCRRQSPPLLRYIPCWCSVTDVTCTVCNALKTRRSERNACVWKWKPDETGRKWIMHCTCNCIAFVQMIT
jgi:hypothetical protein